MDSEVSPSKGADKLIGLELSLKNVLGEDWKGICIFSNLEQAMSTEEYQMLQNARTVNSHEAKTEAEHFIVRANSIFTTNDSPYKAQLLTDQHGKQLVYIFGRIGNDTIYHITETFHFIDQPWEAVQWTAKKIGFIGGNGKVFSIDRLLQISKYFDNRYALKFITVAGAKQMEENQYTQDGVQTVLSTPPTNFEEIGEFFHGIGHLLRARKISQDQDMVEAKTEVGMELDEMARSGRNYKKKSVIDDYRIRKILSGEERSSWGICLSLIKEAGREAGLDIASNDVIKRMLNRAETHLTDYDRGTPYFLADHRENKTIPAFSQKERVASMKLHDVIKRAGIRYSDLQNQGTDTDINIPSKLLQTVKLHKKTEERKEK